VYIKLIVWWQWRESKAKQDEAVLYWPLQTFEKHYHYYAFIIRIQKIK